jgi:beta-ureidopropionase
MPTAITENASTSKRISTTKKISIVQSGGLTGNRDADLAGLIDLFREAAVPGTDLVVFPELCTTPYFGATDNDTYKAWAEPVDGPSVRLFAQSAKDLGTAVILGFYELGPDGEHYNSAVVIEADGSIVTGVDLDGEPVRTYRKTSIPKGLVADVPVNEKYFFAEGQGPALFEVAGMRIACLICYDRTFPEYWLGSLALGADVVVPLVSSLGTREKLFQQELQIRAMETQTWVLAANRGGEETVDGTTISYFGLSCVVDPRGELIAGLPAHTHGQILQATIDPAEVAAARSHFPLSRDRQPKLLLKVADAFLAGERAGVNA